MRKRRGRLWKASGPKGVRFNSSVKMMIDRFFVLLCVIKCFYYVCLIRSMLDLVGTHVNIDSGEWTEQTTGIGAGVDSVYEYMLKVGQHAFNTYLTRI